MIWWILRARLARQCHSLGTYNFSAALHWHRVTSDLNAGTVWLENSEWHSFRTNECTHTNIECTENLYSSWMSVIRRPRHPRNEAPKQQNNPTPPNLSPSLLIIFLFFLFKCHYPSKQQPRSPTNLSRKPPKLQLSCDDGSPIKVPIFT